jgi:hypothetical protein
MARTQAVPADGILAAKSRQNPLVLLASSHDAPDFGLGRIERQLIQTQLRFS